MAQFRIKSYHDVCTDSFEHGQGDTVNFWETSSIVEAETPVEALRKYYEREIHKIFDPEKILIDGMDIFDGFMVDEDGVLASDLEIEMFMKGERELFAENIRLHVWQLTPIEVRF